MTRAEVVDDLTTRGRGVDPDAAPLVWRAPAIRHAVPGWEWRGRVGRAQALVRVPDATQWNGRLVLGATPALRSAGSLDLLLSDLVLQRGYAVAACDKATPGSSIQEADPRAMADWDAVHVDLLEAALRLIRDLHGGVPVRTYGAGVSNGGYVVRRLMERHPTLLDGGVDWEGVLWHPDRPHLLRTLPGVLAAYHRWRTRGPTRAAHDALAADMAPFGLDVRWEAAWPRYWAKYWAVTLWVYGRHLDPEFEPFARPWTDAWRTDPTALARYHAAARSAETAAHIAALANTGRLERPLISVAGNADSLVPFVHHAEGYATLVGEAGAGAWHRLYQVWGGNHVDGLWDASLAGQQPVQPYFEAALLLLEDWVERGVAPPASGVYRTPAALVPGADLLSRVPGARGEGG